MDKHKDNWQLWQKRLDPLLSAPAAFYSRAMGLRRAAYSKGWLRSWQPPVPCISVGNICSGGSGKTQVCAWLLQWARQQCLQPLLLSRGYKGRPQELPLLVTLDTLAKECGDEPLMLARLFPEAYIAVDPKRKRAGKWFFTRGSADICILDDGFQHLAVKRDLDLVLFRSRDLEQDWGRVLPRGPWREGSEALKRASAFLLKADYQEFQRLEPKLRLRLGGLGRPIFGFVPRIKAMLRLIDGSRLSPDKWEEDYILLSAVGDPQGVEQSMTSSLGLCPLQHFAFRDHFFLDPQSWHRILNRASTLNAQVICTPKDAVKLEGFASSRVWTVELEVEFGSSLFAPTGFRQWLEQSLVF